ncbi:MAG TPA: M48 family metalloprotease [Terriglobia bacterium]|nr:M48 family metalloprotease [Terriglobia bacterium]
MRWTVRACLSVVLCEILVLLPACRKRAEVGAPPPARPQELSGLQAELQKPYMELFEISPNLRYSKQQIDSMREYLQKGEEYCVDQFKGHAENYQSELEQIQRDLKQRGSSIENGERHSMHCRIQQLRVLESQATVLSQNAIPVAYDNRLAKLDLIENWPAQLQSIKQEIASGAYENRRWGDVKDIGYRDIEPNQRDDIRAGQEAIKQLKQSGMMPPEVKDEAVVEYVNSVGADVAKHSDLQVPLNITVLNSKEINAFALPGGYLYIERGLLDAADDEAELAGVIGHEIAHVTARHSNKLMKRATIAGIIYQAAQIAAIVFTGGVAGIGTYYAFQYGFYGLGLVLSLNLLGVSRDYELQADQLGVQYTWNAGYDPTGFIRFFDKIATKKGYVEGVSWFRTHPPFYTRMVDAEREIMFLPEKPNYIVTTEAFKQMKKALPKLEQEASKDEKNKPSLYDFAKDEGCPVPKKFEFEPDQPIEQLCHSPRLVTVEPPSGTGTQPSK